MYVADTPKSCLFAPMTLSVYYEFALRELDFESASPIAITGVSNRCHGESRHVAQHVIVEPFAGCSAVSECLCTIAFESLLVGIARYHPVVVWRVCEEMLQDDVPEHWDTEWHKLSLGNRICFCLRCREVPCGSSLPRS